MPHSRPCPRPSRPPSWWVEGASAVLAWTGGLVMLTGEAGSVVLLVSALQVSLKDEHNRLASEAAKAEESSKQLQERFQRLQAQVRPACGIDVETLI